MRPWYMDTEKTYAVAEWAVEQGEILTLGDVLRFFERPKKYQDWYDGWEKDQITQGELQDERRAIL